MIHRHRYICNDPPTHHIDLHHSLCAVCRFVGVTEQASDAEAIPEAVERATFQAELDALRIREKTHTREGDAIAAARRRLPMVEVDPTLALIGACGPLTLLDAFEGRRELIAYYFMWDPGRPAAEQCEGCTFFT